MTEMMRKNKETDITPQKSEGIDRMGLDYSPFAWFRRMDRWFDEFRREFDSQWFEWPRSGASATSGLAVREPTIDLQDSGAEFVVTAEMPGVSNDDVQISATPDTLEIRAETRGEREEKDDAYVVRERNYSAFYRSVPLPGEVVPDNVVATLKDGTLEVRLPKQAPTPAPKSVAVKVA